MKLSGSIIVSTAILLFGVTVVHGAAFLSPPGARVRPLRDATRLSPASLRLSLPLVAKYQQRPRQPAVVSLQRPSVSRRAGAVELNRFGLRRMPANAPVAGVEPHEFR